MTKLSNKTEHYGHKYMTTCRYVNKIQVSIFPQNFLLIFLQRILKNVKYFFFLITKVYMLVIRNLYIRRIVDIESQRSLHSPFQGHALSNKHCYQFGVLSSAFPP